MKKVISPLLIIVLLGFVGYEHYEHVLDYSKLIIQNPAKAVLNANLPKEEDIYTFDNDVYGTIYLDAGTEPTYGLRHILARHTKQFFINYEDKNNSTMFSEDLSGNEIILGIKEFYEHCIDVDAYNRSINRNIAYVGFTVLNNEKVKCLLIVRKNTKQIITFYPFNEIREQEVLEEIEDERQRIEEEKREKERRKTFYYD
ncbi:MAG: hypothetical protein L3J35_10565 [Bacteroidales bacterium]|nr:hypothetical protein [Bacteroidales bacterium]